MMNRGSTVSTWELDLLTSSSSLCQFQCSFDSSRVLIERSLGYLSALRLRNPPRMALLLPLAHSPCFCFSLSLVCTVTKMEEPRYVCWQQEPTLTIPPADKARHFSTSRLLRGSSPLSNSVSTTEGLQCVGFACSSGSLSMADIPLRRTAQPVL